MQISYMELKCVSVFVYLVAKVEIDTYDKIW